jgi:hypothetical protein
MDEKFGNNNDDDGKTLKRMQQAHIQEMNRGGEEEVNNNHREEMNNNQKRMQHAAVETRRFIPGSVREKKDDLKFNNHDDDLRAGKSEGAGLDDMDKKFGNNEDEKKFGI